MTDHEARAQKIARCVRGCTTDDQYQELTMAIATALREAYAAGVEDAAKVVAEYQIVDTADGPILEPRMFGNLAGLAYAVGIRALIPAKED